VFQVRLQKKSHFNRFYRNTQRRDFRSLEDKNYIIFYATNVFLETAAFPFHFLMLIFFHQILGGHFVVT
jgi:hypothetical protein